MNEINIEYKDKYLKYKNKYLSLKNQLSGGADNNNTGNTNTDNTNTDNTNTDNTNTGNTNTGNTNTAGFSDVQNLLNTLNNLKTIYETLNRDLALAEIDNKYNELLQNIRDIINFLNGQEQQTDGRTPQELLDLINGSPNIYELLNNIYGVSRIISGNDNYNSKTDLVNVLFNIFKTIRTLYEKFNQGDNQISDGINRQFEYHQREYERLDVKSSSIPPPPPDNQGERVKAKAEKKP